MERGEARIAGRHAGHGARKREAQTFEQLEDREIDIGQRIVHHVHVPVGAPQHALEVAQELAKALRQKMARIRERLRLLIFVVQPVRDRMVRVLYFLQQVGDRKLKLMRP